MFEIDGDTILFNHEPVGAITVPVGTLRERVEAAFAEAYEGGYARAKEDLHDVVDGLKPPKERDR